MIPPRFLLYPPFGYLAWFPSLNPIQDRLQLLLVDSSGSAQRHQLLVDLISVLSENSTARGLCYWMVAACIPDVMSLLVPPLFRLIGSNFPDCVRIPRFKLRLQVAYRYMDAQSQYRYVS